MDIELLAIDYVRPCFSRTDYLVASINQKDKEPSWDGYIEVYCQPGNTHRKADLIRRVPIQIKGHVCDDLTKESISYSVAVSDLKNFLADGGTAFIVDNIDNKGLNHTAYISRLLPYELKQILKDVKSETYSIRLTKMPTDSMEISTLFMDFARDISYQLAAINADPITLEQFLDEYPKNEISISYTTINDPNNQPVSPFDYLFDHDTYLYGSIAHGIKLPLQHISKIFAVTTTIQKPVCVDGKKYYSHYEEVYTKLNKQFFFGQAIRYSQTFVGVTSSFSFALAGTLEERIVDSAFLLDLFRNRSFTIGENTIIVADNAYQNKETLGKFQRLQEIHDSYLNIKKMLSILNVKMDFDLNSLTETDLINLGALIDAFVYKKPVQINPSSVIGVCAVGNLHLLLWAVKVADCDLFYLYNFTNNPYLLKYTQDTGEEFDSDASVSLTKDHIIHCDNLDFKTIVKQLNAVTPSVLYGNQLNSLLMQILLAYDQTKERRILNFAEGVLGVIHKGPLKESPITILNEMQTILRKQALKPREIKRLKALLNSSKDSYDIVAGVNILLKNKTLANEAIEKMSPEEAAEFRGCPIYSLLNS